MTTAGDPNAIYCVKCKARTESADLKAVTMKNGRAAAQATCVVCGARKMRFGAVRPAVNAGPVARFFRTTRFSARSLSGPHRVRGIRG